MTTLTNINNYLKKYIWFVVAGVILIAIMLLISLKYYFTQKTQTPPVEAPVFENKIISTSKFNTDNLEIPNDSPSKLPLYSISQNDLLEAATGIAKKLGFSGAAVDLKDINLGQGVAYSNNSGSLAIYKNSLNYVRYGPRNVSGKFQTPEELKKNVDDFLVEINQSLQPFKISNVSYYKIIDEFLIKTNNPEEATVLTMTTRPTVSDYELILPGSETTATFNKQNELHSIVYESSKLEQSTKNYPIINSQKAVEYLQKNEGKLLTVGTVNDYTPPPKNLDTVNIEKMHLAYYLPLNSSLSQPVWIFIGKAETSQGAIETTYAIPAIEKSYLINPSPKP